MNPRPFIFEGTYLQKWAVSAAMAGQLAQEFSTPSGHAQPLAFVSYAGFLTGIATKHTLLGIFLRYIRYTVAGLVGMLVAPLLVVTLGLAERRVSSRVDRG